jgi:hypothetical protein
MFHMGKGDMRPEATPRLRPLVLYLNIASLLESGWGSVSTKSINTIFCSPNACDKSRTCVPFGRIRIYACELRIVLCFVVPDVSSMSGYR